MDVNIEFGPVTVKLHMSQEEAAALRILVNRLGETANFRGTQGLALLQQLANVLDEVG